MPVNSAAYTFVVSSLPKYVCAVELVVGEYADAPMCFWIPEPSVYMQSIVGVFMCSLSELSCCALACSLGIFAICVIRLVGVHHGGLMYACISSMVSVMYSGRSLTRYSRLDIKVLFLFMVQYLFDSCSHIFAG